MMAYSRPDVICAGVRYTLSRRPPRRAPGILLAKASGPAVDMPLVDPGNPDNSFTPRKLATRRRRGVPSSGCLALP